MIQEPDVKQARFERFSRVGAAFASPRRVEILELLMQGSRPVDSIAESTGMSMANTSRHLQILRTAGLVAARRDGLHVRYRIADSSVEAGYRALQTLTHSRHEAVPVKSVGSP